MTNVTHPASVLNNEDIVLIRNNAAEAEALGKLNQAQLQLVDRLQWFKLLVPKVYGGLQTSLPDLVRLQEAISWADGSIGWTVTLCCGAGWFGGFMDTALAAKVFATPNVCLAGSGAVSGEAEVTSDGYRISGTWKYASGAHHATHFTANCAIVKNGEAVTDEIGKALVLPFIIDRKDVTLLPAWQYVGMIATGSHSFQIRDALLAKNRSFIIDPAHAAAEGKLYQYPFLQLAEATLAVNLSGMALHFIDLCGDIFQTQMKQPKITAAQQQLMDELLKATQRDLDAARGKLFATVEQSWQTSLTNDAALMNGVSKASRILARTSREAVDHLYPYCGLIAAASDSEINRVWRDIHTAGQHALLTFTD